MLLLGFFFHSVTFAFFMISKNSPEFCALLGLCYYQNLLTHALSVSGSCGFDTLKKTAFFSPRMRLGEEIGILARHISFLLPLTLAPLKTFTHYQPSYPSLPFEALISLSLPPTLSLSHEVFPS